MTELEKGAQDTFRMVDTIASTPSHTLFSVRHGPDSRARRDFRAAEAESWVQLAAGMQQIRGIQSMISIPRQRLSGRWRRTASKSPLLACIRQSSHQKDAHGYCTVGTSEEEYVSNGYPIVPARLLFRRATSPCFFIASAPLASDVEPKRTGRVCAGLVAPYGNNTRWLRRESGLNWNLHPSPGGWPRHLGCLNAGVPIHKGPRGDQNRFQAPVGLVGVSLVRHCRLGIKLAKLIGHGL